jgi:hypothetical protein
LAKKNRWAKLREDKKRNGSEDGPDENLRMACSPPEIHGSLWQHWHRFQRGLRLAATAWRQKAP